MVGMVFMVLWVNGLAPRLQNVGYIGSNPIKTSIKQKDMNNLYVLIEWPQSQIISDWKSEYYEQCIFIDDAGIMVPAELWSQYEIDSEKFIREE